MSEQEKSPKEFLPLSDEEIDEAEENLAMALEAYDERGEDGLQEALDRIYPPDELTPMPSGRRRIPIFGGNGSWATLFRPEDRPKTRPATSADLMPTEPERDDDEPGIFDSTTRDNPK